MKHLLVALVVMSGTGYLAEAQPVTAQQPFPEGAVARCRAGGFVFVNTGASSCENAGGIAEWAPSIPHPAAVAGPEPVLLWTRACEDMVKLYAGVPDPTAVLQHVWEDMGITTIETFNTFCAQLEAKVGPSRPRPLSRWRQALQAFADNAPGAATGSLSRGWYVSTYSNQPVAGPFVLLNECMDMATIMSKRYFNVSTVCQSK